MDKTAIVELRAMVRDITAVNPSSDPQAGNITNPKKSVTIAMIQQGVESSTKIALQLALKGTSDGCCLNVWLGIEWGHAI